MDTKFLRKDILDLTTTEKDQLIRAFRGIQELSPDNPDSFFSIAAFHGQPFRGPGYSNKDWWGGYCHHGNVLFPTWHRAYLLRLETALRKVPGCETLALPYWNQMRTYQDRVIPEIFTQERYILDGKSIENPLYSYKLQRGFFDNLSRVAQDKELDLSKHKGYVTVRHPYSGLVGNKDRERTRLYNESIGKQGASTAASMLDENVKNWLDGYLNTPKVSSADQKSADISGMREKYLRCLYAPNYTVFSNTTSAAKWNDDNLGHPGEDRGDEQESGVVVSLETPHNGIHLAVGGCNMMDQSTVKEANGDMGENDTASFDPLFYFHHAFVDMVFWSWQVLHNSEDTIEFIPGYPGTSSVDSQGPTPGILAGSWLTEDSPLDPFLSEDGEPLTSKDMVNIHALGYSYDSLLRPPGPVVAVPKPILRLSGINRTSIAGSFVITIWAKTPEGEKMVGYEPVFSRWYVPGCANCGNTLLVTAHVPLTGKSFSQVKDLDITVKLLVRDNKSGEKVVLGPSEEGIYSGPLKGLNVHVDSGKILLLGKKEPLRSRL